MNDDKKPTAEQILLQDLKVLEERLDTPVEQLTSEYLTYLGNIAVEAMALTLIDNDTEFYRPIDDAILSAEQGLAAIRNNEPVEARRHFYYSALGLQEFCKSVEEKFPEIRHPGLFEIFFPMLKPDYTEAKADEIDTSGLDKAKEIFTDEVRLKLGLDDGWKDYHAGRDFLYNGIKIYEQINELKAKCSTEAEYLEQVEPLAEQQRTYFRGAIECFDRASRDPRQATYEDAFYFGIETRCYLADSMHPSDQEAIRNAYNECLKKIHEFSKLGEVNAVPAANVRLFGASIFHLYGQYQDALNAVDNTIRIYDDVLQDMPDNEFFQQGRKDALEMKQGIKELMREQVSSKL